MKVLGPALLPCQAAFDCEGSSTSCVRRERSSNPNVFANCCICCVYCHLQALGASRTDTPSCSLTQATANHASVSRQVVTLPAVSDTAWEVVTVCIVLVFAPSERRLHRLLSSSYNRLTMLSALAAPLMPDRLFAGCAAEGAKQLWPAVPARQTLDHCCSGVAAIHVSADLPLAPTLSPLPMSDCSNLHMKSAAPLN